MKSIFFFLLIILCCVNAQQSIKYKFTSSVFDQGGATSSSNNFKLSSSTGQPIQSIFSSGSSFVLNSGFMNISFIPTDIKKNDKAPSEYKLNQNYPNPFNPVTVISWQIPISGQVTLKIYDILGKEVATLINEFKQAGTYESKFSASELPSGIYIYKIIAGNFSDTKKLIIMK